MATVAPFSDASLAELEQVSILGTGKASTVWLARRDGEYCALKVIPKSKVMGKKQMQQVFSERDLLKAVHCPFTLRLYRTLKDADNLYFVTDVAGGGELIKHIRAARGGRLPIATARTYTAELVTALGAIHACGAVYRDIKANNVVLDCAGRTKLIDFGFAKEVDTDELGGRTMTYCGTPHAMAPEVILRTGHGKAVDWWGLGVLVYEMIVGTAPFGYSSAGRAKRPETSGTLSRGVVEEKDEAKVEHVCSATETDARRAADSQEPGSSELERAILSGVSAVEWPDEVFSDEAEGHAALDFIQKLLEVDESKRLGAGGSSEVMAHEWLKGVDWDSVKAATHKAPTWDKSLAEWLGKEDEIDPDVDAALFGDF